MAAKTFVICALAVFVKAISAQCLGPLNGPGFVPEIFSFGGPGFIPDIFSFGGPGNPFGPGYGPSYGPAGGSCNGLSGMTLSNLGASCGGGFAVTSSSPISPTGLSVTSENAIEGALAVAGNLPFLGTVALEGLYQTLGAGSVSYGCGNGAIGITAENVAPGLGPVALPQAAIAPSPAMGPGMGYPLGYMGPRPGCGAIY